MKIGRDSLWEKTSKVFRTIHPLCQICSKDATQVHHFKSRKNRSVRYDFDNLWSLCFGCHRKFHEDPDWAVRQQVKRLGIRYDAFILKANSICKRTSEDKKLISIWLDQQKGASK